MTKAKIEELERHLKECDACRREAGEVQVNILEWFFGQDTLISRKIWDSARPTVLVVMIAREDFLQGLFGNAEPIGNN